MIQGDLLLAIEGQPRVQVAGQAGFLDEGGEAIALRGEAQAEQFQKRPSQDDAPQEEGIFSPLKLRPGNAQLVKKTETGLAVRPNAGNRFYDLSFCPAVN